MKNNYDVGKVYPVEQLVQEGWVESTLEKTSGLMIYKRDGDRLVGHMNLEGFVIKGVRYDPKKERG